jgi:hypothetical protein
LLLAEEDLEDKTLLACQVVVVVVVIALLMEHRVVHLQQKEH